MIIWLTGNSGAGKTTIAKRVATSLHAILLDGDRMRASVSRDLGFSREDRHENNMRLALLAKELSDQGFNVVVAVIAPYKETRNLISDMVDPVWCYIKRDSLPPDPERPYEPPQNAACVVDTDVLSIRESVELILGAVKGSARL